MGRRSKKKRGSGPSIESKILISSWHLKNGNRDNLWHPFRRSTSSSSSYEDTFMQALNLRNIRAT